MPLSCSRSLPEYEQAWADGSFVFRAHQAAPMSSVEVMPMRMRCAVRKEWVGPIFDEFSNWRCVIACTIRWRIPGVVSYYSTHFSIQPLMGVGGGGSEPDQRFNFGARVSSMAACTKTDDEQKWCCCVAEGGWKWGGRGDMAGIVHETYPDKHLPELTMQNCVRVRPSCARKVGGMFLE
jgi:hypothetical protein